MRLMIVLVVLFSVSCAGTSGINKSEIIEIRWGTSFGMCRGYCYAEYQYTPEGTRLIRKGWDTAAYPKTLEVFSPKPGEWTELKASIDLATFNALPERIGCPDCADGGAEWIEIITSEGGKKVTYEYGQVPTGLNAILKLLRK
ncbi:MAG TPA: hypothetical protein DIW47_08610 [Bacteroidetes bacterium]|nr:hypothetical protein [Bacteroidota bacterium]